MYSKIKVAEYRSRKEMPSRIHQNQESIDVK